MRKELLAITILVLVIVVFTTVASENELPLSESIKILSITPYSEATRGVFEDTRQDITYEAIKESVLEKIRTGFRPECDCDFDNAFFLSLANRPIVYGSERDNPPVIRFPGTFKEGGDKLIDIRIQCRIILSRNKKYAGLVFQQVINTGLTHQHFLLANSKGDILWEMPHEMNETLADNLLRRMNFPNDSESRIDGHYHVSNDGKVLYLKSHMYDSEKYWELYHKDGKRIKKQSNWCALAEFSPDGSYFLVQENNEPQSSQFDSESGTSCYDANTGELLWRKKNILPIQDAGYFISPSGNKILACRKRLFYDLCFLDRKGKVLSGAGQYEKTRSGVSGYDTSAMYPHWAFGETKFIWGKSIGDTNFKSITFFPDLTSSRNDQFQGLLILDVIPYGDKHLVAVGFRKSKSYGEILENYKEYRFIAILDDRMNFLSATVFHTDFSADTANRLLLDSRAARLYWNTNDFSLESEVILPGETK